MVRLSMFLRDHAAKCLFSALLASVLTCLGGGALWIISGRLLFAYHRAASASSDSIAIRQIGQASLIYADDHHGRLPDATDLPDYARLLALHGGLDDVSYWVSGKDHAAIPSNITTVLVTGADGSRTLDPRFTKLPHLVTIVLGGLTVNNPSTTPIAWTRGLDFETGEWSKHSRYSGEGGYILFIGGNVRFYRTLRNSFGGELVSRDGSPTHRILDALPPNTRISDNTVTPAPLPTFTQRAGKVFRRIPNFVRTAIMFAWPLWMIALFFKLTFSFARTWHVPLAKVRFEPRRRWVVLVPVALLLLSVLFQV